MIERTDAVNWSSLRHMCASPKHYRHALVSPREDTEAMQQGRLVHALVYEPDAVASRYVREPRFHGGQNDDTARSNGYDGGKQAKAAFVAANTREIIPSDMWERAHAMAGALAADPIAAPLIVGGYSEQLIHWVDSDTGIECRGRIDHLNGALSDLKTSRSIEPRWFASQAVRLGYHGQIAYYADGLAANGVTLALPPCWIVVENVAPFDVIVLDIDDDTLAAGRALYRSCLDRLAECRALDRWPGVADGARSWFVLPAWAGVAKEAPTLDGEPIEL